MNIPFNYNNVKHVLLALFISLFFLSITGEIEPKIIDSNAVMYYSIFGFIICIFSLSFDKQIQNRAKRIRADTGLYFSEVDDIRIDDILSKKDENSNFLLIFLLFALIVGSIFRNISTFSLLIIYSSVGIFYLFILLYQFELVDESY